MAYLLIKYWIKFVNWLIPTPKQKQQKVEFNPYIEQHRMKMKNDKWYEEYLEWLDKNGGDIPFEKWKTEEEKKFNEKMNN